LESWSIKVAFAAPPLGNPLLQESRPDHVFSHILGHDLPGLLHVLLNNKGAMDCQVDIRDWDWLFGFFHFYTDTEFDSRGYEALSQSVGSCL
jgi:hypothetical protein